MGSEDQDKGNELEVARAELVKALRRVVKAELGDDASFAERETAALAASHDAAARGADIHREQQGSDERYVTLREAGLPVGSGITEGACKVSGGSSSQAQRSALAQ